MIMGLSRMLFFVPEIVIMGFGGYLVLRGEISVGQVLAFRFVYTSIREGIDGFIQTLPMYKEATTAGERIFEITDMATEGDEHQSASVVEEAACAEAVLCFDHVYFRYPSGSAAPGESATLDDQQRDPFELRNLCFELMPGETVALVGPSGCGKTTVLKLIAGLHDPCSGTITYKGAATRAQHLEKIREGMAMVFQDPFLFPATIHNNIAYGRGTGVSESDGIRENIPVAEDILLAARNANIHEFITGLPRGYESLVGERGVKLSGGQMQRISIARAILKQPSLLLLDEPTSALDMEAEDRVQKALARLMKGRASVVVAHRLSSIRHATRILVLDNGAIVERGTHTDLMAGEGLYFNLYRLQAQDGAEQ